VTVFALKVFWLWKAYLAFEGVHDFGNIGNDLDGSWTTRAEIRYPIHSYI
jgi:hypothetical protein